MQRGKKQDEPSHGIKNTQGFFGLFISFHSFIIYEAVGYKSVHS